MTNEEIFEVIEKNFADLISIPFVYITLQILSVILLATIALYINKKFAIKLTERVKASNDKKNLTYLLFLKNAISAMIYFVSAIAILSNVPGFENGASAILASTGVLTVVVGFASQEAMSNIISGVMILVFNPFVVGDTIRYVDKNIVGTIEEITLRHTVIKTLENKRLIVPNGSMNKDMIENSNFSETKVCMFLEIGISYDSSVDKAREIIVNNVKSHKDYLDNRTKEQKKDGIPQVIVRVIELGDSSVVLKAWVWAKDMTTGFVMKCDLLESIKKDFDNGGIEIPFPQVTVSKKI